MNDSACSLIIQGGGKRRAEGMELSRGCVVGFHWRASFCASAIRAGVVFCATLFRSSAAFLLALRRRQVEPHVCPDKVLRYASPIRAHWPLVRFAVRPILGARASTEAMGESQESGGGEAPRRHDRCRRHSCEDRRRGFLLLPKLALAGWLGTARHSALGPKSQSRSHQPSALPSRRPVCRRRTPQLREGLKSDHRVVRHKCDMWAWRLPFSGGRPPKLLIVQCRTLAMTPLLAGAAAIAANDRQPQAQRP